MRAVVQRVLKASVSVDGHIVGSIGHGLCVLLGVEVGDSEKDALYLAEKISGLRIFEDDADKMNRSVADVGGSVLCVSQFTLLGDCRKGKRPSFIKAGRPESAVGLYEQVVAALKHQNVPVETGAFQTHMVVSLENDGPVTLLLDSRKQF